MWCRVVVWKSSKRKIGWIVWTSKIKQIQLISKIIRLEAANPCWRRRKRKKGNRPAGYVYAKRVRSKTTQSSLPATAKARVVTYTSNACRNGSTQSGRWINYRRFKRIIFIRSRNAKFVALCTLIWLMSEEICTQYLISASQRKWII